MATTVNLTAKQDGVPEGTLTTLNVNVPDRDRAERDESQRQAPDVRIIARATASSWAPAGTGISRQTNEEYLSVKLAAPSSA